jgi:hypothetical protein
MRKCDSFGIMMKWWWGKAFPLAGAKVAGTPPSAGDSPATPPFRVRVRTGFVVTG